MKIKRPKTKSVLKRLQKRAETLWKLACLKRDKVCVRCGGKEVLQVHHIFSRKNKDLFLDVDNGVVLCRRHHAGVTWDDSAKEWLRRYLIDKDKATYDRLYEQSLIKGSFLEWKNIEWLEEQIAILEQLT